jgi:hypothetical protein
MHYNERMASALTGWCKIAVAISLPEKTLRSKNRHERTEIKTIYGSSIKSDAIILLVYIILYHHYP